MEQRLRSKVEDAARFALSSSTPFPPLTTMCDGNVLEKVRHFVSHEGNNWHVDVYEGLLDGVVLAEIELADAGQEFALPDWIGAEVTSDPRYRKINMLADHVATQKSADTALLARADEVIE